MKRGSDPFTILSNLVERQRRFWLSRKLLSCNSLMIGEMERLLVEEMERLAAEMERPAEEMERSAAKMLEKLHSQELLRMILSPQLECHLVSTSGWTACLSVTDIRRCSKRDAQRVVEWLTCSDRTLHTD